MLMYYRLSRITLSTPRHVEIKNDGPKLVDSNWWSLPGGEDLYFLSANAGALRLLVPDSWVLSIPEMTDNVQNVVVSKNQFPERGLFAVEILFDDGSVTPFSIQLSINQTDCLLADLGSSGPVPLLVYVNHGGPLCVLRMSAHIRPAPRLPWLKPLTAQPNRKSTTCSEMASK
jgi:hypothetical protein